jgi:uncharacterized protein (TIGR03084 family)
VSAALATLIADLVDEQERLHALLAPLPAADWERPTPAVGWDVRDQLAHIALVELHAVRAVTDPAGFERAVAEAAADPVAFERGMYERGRAYRGPDLLDIWAPARRTVVETLRSAPDGTRISWWGPAMGARSFLTARLMETWSHGQDVRDALGVPTPVTPGLRHIAHLGVLTHGWSYVVRGQDPDPTPVAVELTGPGGERWTWGDPELSDRITGEALDFCLVVTQRRHWRDTGLDVQGAAAARWMDVAQAFAGPPTITAPHRGVPTRGEVHV